MKHILACILIIALLGSAWGLPVRAQEAAVICLDPGHGGTNPGAVYEFADGKLLKEADINLDVALALKTLLEQSGQRVIMMTRTDNRSNPTTRERYLVANNAKATLLVSIHTNSIVPEIAAEIDGTCTLYMKEADKPLAAILESNVYSALLTTAPDSTIFLDRGERRFFSRIMSRTTMPAVIVEPVFMSLPGEATKLASPIQRDSAGHILANTRRAEIAYALHSGILSYLDAQAQAANNDKSDVYYPLYLLPRGVRS